MPVGDWPGHAQGGEWTAPKGKCALPKVPDLMGGGTPWRVRNLMAGIYLQTRGYLPYRASQRGT